MDFKEMQQQLAHLRAAEDTKTVAFIRDHLETHSLVFDLSNKFLFDAACDELITALKTHYTKRNTLRKLTLQNVMLETEKLNSLLRGLLSVKKPLSLRFLDIGNNRIDLSEDSAELLSRLLSKKVNAQGKTLILQGNTLQNPQAICMLFAHASNLSELNLYDTRLSVEALTALAQALASGVKIKKLDLGYNAEAFVSVPALEAFGTGVSLNSKLEHVNLGGNHTLQKPKRLEALLNGLKGGRSLESLGFGGISLGDPGVELFLEHMANSCVCVLDLHNNGIGAAGFQALLKDLPQCLTSLDLSYNQITDQRTLLSLAQALTRTRTLRSLNISHSIEIEEMSFKVKTALGEAIKTNDSLTEFYCEGAKIGDDPDDFCDVLGQAISERRLSLTFKISAVNCFQAGYSQLSSSYQSLGSHSSQVSREKIISVMPSVAASPSRPPQVNSTLQTERRNCEAESREASLSATPREYCFTSNSQADKSPL